MATCKDCLHFEVCNFMYGEEFEQHWPPFWTCDRFKDRSRFVELPCKVGDIMYVWGDTLPTHRLDMEDSEIPSVFPAIVVSIRKNTKSVWVKLRIYSRWLHPQYDKECGLYEDGVDMWKYFTFPASTIGKTVFPTREEAEAKLSKMNGGESNE